MSDKQTGEEAQPTERRKTPLELKKEQQAKLQNKRGNSSKRADSGTGGTGQGSAATRPTHGPQKMG